MLAGHPPQAIRSGREGLGQVGPANTIDNRDFVDPKVACSRRFGSPPGRVERSDGRGVARVCQGPSAQLAREELLWLRSSGDGDFEWSTAFWSPESELQLVIFVSEWL